MDPAVSSSPKRPITADRITDAALQVVATEGYEALAIRRVGMAAGHTDHLAGYLVNTR